MIGEKFDYLVNKFEPNIGRNAKPCESDARSNEIKLDTVNHPIIAFRLMEPNFVVAMTVFVKAPCNNVQANVAAATTAATEYRIVIEISV